MTTIKHPTLPVRLDTSNGNVRLYIRDIFAAHITSLNPFSELDEKTVKMLQTAKKTPAEINDFRMIPGTPPAVCGTVTQAWVLEQIPALLAEAQIEADAIAAKCAAVIADKAAKEKPLIEAMETKLAAIVAVIPADAIRLEVIHTGDFDGYPQLTLKHGNVEINLGADGVKLDSAHAIRPGAMASFASRYVAWATPEAIATATASHEARQAKAAKAAAEHQAELSKPVPAKAIKSYMACRGNPERLPDDIDNPDYWLVKNYAEAIEHQGLANQASLARALELQAEAAREASAGINPEA